MSAYETQVAEIMKKPPIINGKRVPFIIFGWEVNDWSGGAGNPTKKPNVVAFPLIHCHALPAVIQRYVNRGRKVLGYWFPQNAKSEVEEVLPDGSTTRIVSYTELEATCRSYMGINAQVEERESAMQRKIDEQKAELEKLRKAQK